MNLIKEIEDKLCEFKINPEDVLIHYNNKSGYSIHWFGSVTYGAWTLKSWAYDNKGSLRLNPMGRHIKLYADDGVEYGAFDFVMKFSEFKNSYSILFNADKEKTKENVNVVELDYQAIFNKKMVMASENKTDVINKAFPGISLQLNQRMVLQDIFSEHPRFLTEDQIMDIADVLGLDHLSYNDKYLLACGVIANISELYFIHRQVSFQHIDKRNQK